MALDSGGSCLKHCSEHTGHAVTASTRSPNVQGQLASLTMCHSTWALMLFLCTKSAVSTIGSVARAHVQAGGQLPDYQGLSAPWEPGHGRQCGLPQVLAGEPNVFLSFHISWPLEGLFMITHPLAFHCPIIGLIPLQWPNYKYKGLMARTYEWSPAKLSEFSPLATVVCYRF